MRALRDAPDRDAALAKLIAEFEVDENTARRDIDQFLSSIEKIGWLP